MSHFLWEYFYNEEFKEFQNFLFQSSQDTPLSTTVKIKNTSSFLENDKTSYSLNNVAMRRKISNHRETFHSDLSRDEINSRDYVGLTILHRVVSSNSINMIRFAKALLNHHAIDLYAQDVENGWTALHRALYFGNVSIARAIIEKDSRPTNGRIRCALPKDCSSIIKVKDYEGNTAFDVYNETISRPATKYSGNEEPKLMHENLISAELPNLIGGDEVLAWGSNRNHGLGFRDQDDRRHPEKITLQRRDHLLFRFYREYLKQQGDDKRWRKEGEVPKHVSDLPTLITNRPVIIQDVVLSKLHSAILTTDPESNLYMCGFGPGGRLGTGDQDTRFTYVPIDGGPLAGQKVSKVALGQDHTLAILTDGSIIAWGSNMHYQLGFSVPSPRQDGKEYISTYPQAISGILKKEIILTAAASAHHSVACTATSLFVWGKNEGQLGLMNSESQGNEYQHRPRKVASSVICGVPITLVSATNSATIILLSTQTVIVLINYRRYLVKFPCSEGFSKYNLNTGFSTSFNGSRQIPISSITAGGNTIGAVSTRGDLFILTTPKNSKDPSNNKDNSAETRGPLSKPELVWSPRKGTCDRINTVGIAESGSVIVSTQDGAVWRCVKQAKSHNLHSTDSNSSCKKYKYERIPGLSKIEIVRSTIYGVCVAVQKNSVISDIHIPVQEQELWADIKPLFVFGSKETTELVQRSINNAFSASLGSSLTEPITENDLACNLEANITQYLPSNIPSGIYNMEVGTSNSRARIPVHSFILGRSSVLRKALVNFRHIHRDVMSDVFVIKDNTSSENNIKTSVIFQGLDFITLFNLVMYFYTDNLVEFWEFTSHFKNMTSKYNHIREDLFKVASYLELEELKVAMRSMTKSKRCLSTDMYFATLDPDYFEDGDTIIELEDCEIRVHSAIICQRCPFFKSLFNGRAAGQWLSARRQKASESIRINFKHIQLDIFRLVRRYIYADIDTNLFGDVVCGNVDEFADLVLGVMATADELMLDRLSKICQNVLCCFVNDRNICNLLNLIAPCSVSIFKDFALSYICQRLDSMLENHFLDNLEESLLQELNDVVRKNQKTCLPFVKSGQIDSMITKKYPELSEEIREERVRRCRDSAFLARCRYGYRPSSASKPHENISKAITSCSPEQQITIIKAEISQKSISGLSEKSENLIDNLTSPIKNDHLITNKYPNSPFGGSKPINTNTKLNKSVIANLNCSLDEIKTVVSESSTSSLNKTNQDEKNMTTIKVWPAADPQSSKLQSQQTIARVAHNSPSTSSNSRKPQNNVSVENIHIRMPKLSQRERKKKCQEVPSKSQRSANAANELKSTPWNIPAKITRVSLNEILNESPPEANTCQTPLPPSPKHTSSLQTLQTGSVIRKNLHSASSSPHTSELKSVEVADRSTSYFQSGGRAKPPLQLSMADIICQQKREQEILSQARASRSLRDIQEEQAFQEWWDRESRRTQMNEVTSTISPVIVGKKKEKKKKNKQLPRAPLKKDGENQGNRSNK